MKTTYLYLSVAIFIAILKPVYGELSLDKSILIANDFECIKVINEDSIQINLAASYSSQLFSSSSLSGPYTSLTASEIDENGLSLSIGNQATASTITWFYFFDSSDNSYSDTLSNIVLDVDPMNGGGIANLSWNHPFTSSFQVPFGSFYSVMREYPIGVWEEITQVDVGTNLYLDTITICSEFLNYRIDLEIGNSCYFSSNVSGDLFNNNTPPDIPNILQVSVDTSAGFTSLTWQVPPQGDVQGYVIVQNIGGFSVAIDTVWNPNVTYYVDLQSDVNTEVYSYGIAAFDTCLNPNSNPPFYYISPPTALVDFQNSILLENEYFGCDQYNQLYWNSYNNWPGGVLNYELYVSQDGGSYQLLSDLSASDTSYVHENLILFSTYCYVVKAVSTDQNRTSLSNILCQEVVYPGLPDVVYVSSTQVDSAENVTIEFFIDSQGDIDIEGFNVQALYPTSFNYLTIGYISYDGQMNYSFIDENTPADDGSIYYRLQVIDGCGNSNFLSNEINTVYLNAITDDENAINTIVWNQAEGRAGYISEYNLYRVHDEGLEELIYTGGAGEFYYEDDLSEEWEKEGDYCYFIKTVEVSNIYGNFNESQSNEDCTLINPRVWIPNSFIVNGDVPTFTPVFAYAGVKEYRMTIINRWGAILYETQDVYNGWDGYFKGNPVLQGVYIYVIELEDGFGKLLTETGTVTVFSER